MGKQVNIREASKVLWQAPGNENDYPGDTNIQLGCLMRIADATEKMAGNYTQLQNERDMYKRWYNNEVESTKRMAKQIAAYKGIIKKLKSNS